MESGNPTTQSLGDIKGLVEQLGLQAHDKELFVGKVRGFPIGIKFIGSNESLLLLCQIRYPVDAETQGIRRIECGADVDRLIEQKRLELSIENKIAWVTIPDSSSLIESGSLPGIIDSLITGLEKSGLAGLQGKCHYCQREDVSSIICRDGKVAQICESCLAGRSRDQSVGTHATFEGVSKVFSLGSVASLFGALSWAIVWAGYDRLFEFLSVKRIFVPRVIELIVMVGVGFLVGGPVGFILKKIPNRGDLLAAWIAIAFALASVVLGEILYVTWLIYKAFGVISPSVATKVLPRYLADAGLVYFLEKILFALAAVSIAYQMARPKKKGLKL